MELTLYTPQFSGNINQIIMNAFQHEIDYLRIGIVKTKKKIQSFEQKYHCNFRQSIKKIDPLDFIEWEGEIKVLKLLKNKQKFLQQVKLCS